MVCGGIGDHAGSVTEMNPIAYDDRRKLRDAVIAYMNGTIRTYRFDDLNCECLDSRDESVRQISKLLYQIHDDTVDHPISVSENTWKTLTRIVAFLDTDLAADEKMENNFWPFKDEDIRNSHPTNISRTIIPSYNPEIHALPVHGPLNRIPAIVGLGTIALTTVFLALIVWGATK